MTDRGDINPQMQRIFAVINQPVLEVKRILELNSDHPVLEKMTTLFDSNKKDPEIADYSELLYD